MGAVRLGEATVETNATGGFTATGRLGQAVPPCEVRVTASLASGGRALGAEPAYATFQVTESTPRLVLQARRADIRQSVYCSLHQTHLPRLHRHGIVDYDDDRKEITLRPAARKVNIYMEVFSPYGITWSTFYRWTGVLGMLLIIADQMALFGIAGDYSVLIASVFLAGVVLSRLYQLWSDNWIQVRGVLSR